MHHSSVVGARAEEKQKRQCDVYLRPMVCAAARVFNVYESAGAMFLISLPAIPAAPISFLCTPHKNIIIIIYMYIRGAQRQHPARRRLCVAAYTLGANVCRVF